MSRRNTILLTTLLALGAFALPARAGLVLDAWRGHISFGYAKLVSDSLAPAGSLSVAGGVDYPLARKWRLGPTLSFDLLGSSNVTRGSVTAGLDYSLFEAALMTTYLPEHGPFARLAAGPGIASARSELSVAAGGAGFRDLPVGEVQPEFASDLTVMSRHLPIVAVGGELGMRILPIRKRAWTLLTARLAIHF